MSQEDLLAVASEISAIAVDLSKLATCLEVPQDPTSENGTKRDKIVNLFLMWQTQNHPNSSNSKANLQRCLQQLDNPSIDGILRKFCGQQNENMLV